MLRGKEPTTAADVYSFAVVMYELFSRKEPYEGDQCITFDLEFPPYVNLLCAMCSTLNLHVCYICGCPGMSFEVVFRDLG